MAVISGSISISSQGFTDVHEITGQIADLLRQSGLVQGIVTVFCPSSTSGITTIEYEPGCVADLRRMFDELIPIERPYEHDNTWRDANGYSHMRTALLKPSLTIPFVSGKLTLGAWQQVIFVDFDHRPRQRELVVQMMGE